MNTDAICRGIVWSNPYPVVFVDLNHVVRYMNRAARYHYCEERGHGDLVGKSLFDCHFNPASEQQIRRIVDGFRRDSKEIHLKVSDRNLRVYVAPVRAENAELIGYYERFELNLALDREPARPPATGVGAVTGHQP